MLDQHPATRAGLDAILRATEGVDPVGTAADRRELWPLLEQTDPDVVVIDDLRLALAVRTRFPLANVIVHTAGASEDMIAPAAFAGASALVDKACSVEELVAAIRGERLLKPISPRMLRRAATPLDGPDRAILAMRLAGTPDREIAKIVGISHEVLAARSAAIVSRLATSLEPVSA